MKILYCEHFGLLLSFILITSLNGHFKKVRYISTAIIENPTKNNTNDCYSICTHFLSQYKYLYTSSNVQKKVFPQ